MAGLDDGPQALLSGSAIGYYGDRGDEVLDETSSPGTGFLADVAQAWEATHGTGGGGRVARRRTCAPGSCSPPTAVRCRKMLPLFKFGARRTLRHRSPVDELDRPRRRGRARSSTCSRSEVDGPVNLTAPEPVRNAELADTLGDVLHRPTVAAGPGVRPEAAARRRARRAPCCSRASASCRTVLQADGYAWRDPTLEPALRAALHR